jgi:beta-lactamase superfamily II metal-dependent hydrolase
MRNNSKTKIMIALLLIGAAGIYYLLNKRDKPQPEFIPGPEAGRLVVRFLDIGQGDCQLIQLPDGGTILIDSGDRGKPTVELLRKYGVNAIDLMIASHPHADHIGELRDVLREFNVKEFWDSGFTDNPTKTYTDMLVEIKKQGVKFVAPKQGVTRQFGDVHLEVINPPATFIDDRPNNASIVVRLTYGNKRFLFTGDAEIESWKKMLASEREKLRADVLKSAHHGSSNGTTKEILEAVNPSIYTISCAAGNEYHHPHPKVVDLLERRRNIQVYRTDLGGTITAVCDGNSIEMSTEKEIAQNLMYATGDEVAGNMPNGGNTSMDSGSRGGKRKR